MSRSRPRSQSIARRVRTRKGYNGGGICTNTYRAKRKRSSSGRQLNIYQGIVYVLCKYIFARRSHRVYFPRFSAYVPARASPALIASLKTPIYGKSTSPKPMIFDNETGQSFKASPPMSRNRIARAPGDGNCFFTSISMIISQRDNGGYLEYNSEIKRGAKLVRYTVADEIQDHPDRYRGFLIGETIDEAADRIRRSGEWADHLEGQAFANATGVTIVVRRTNGTVHRHVPMNSPVIQSAPITLEYSGNHYDPVG